MLDIELLAASGKAFDGHYKLIRPLSTDGGTADVWLALDLNTVNNPDTVGDLPHMHDDEIEQLGLIVAIKIYRPQNALDVEGEQRFREEYMIVFNCHHTNLIHPTHYSIFHETPYLVLPYCKLGSSELLIGNIGDVENLWKYISDVASGLAYLHALEPPIIHQDIKPANVLLDDNLNYSITDFGISTKRGNGSDDYLGIEKSGTMAYMAPERFNEETPPNPPSDIWAFGATLYEIVTGKVPFGEEGGWTQVKRQAPLPDVPGVSADIQRLIHDCLDPDPDKRPTAKELSKSAEVHKYPYKPRKTWQVITAIALCALLIGGAVSFFLAKQTEEVVIVKEEVYQAPPEEVYEHAMSLMSMAEDDSLRAGVMLMDSLSDTGFVPALYEMAFTYGWYSDTLSVSRKQRLDIDIFTSGDSKFMPKSDRWTTKAMDLFTKILEQKDTAYANLNAEAAYRMACYYEVPNDIIQRNPDKSKRHLLNAREWALLCGDEALLKRIDTGLQRLEK